MYTGTGLVGGCDEGLRWEGLPGSAPSTKVCSGEGRRTGPRCCHCQACAGPVWPCRVGPVGSRARGLYSQHQPVAGLAAPGKGVCPCAQLFAAKALTSKAPSHWGDGTRCLAQGRLACSAHSRPARVTATLHRHSRAAPSGCCRASRRKLLEGKVMA